MVYSTAMGLTFCDACKTFITIKRFYFQTHFIVCTLNAFGFVVYVPSAVLSRSLLSLCQILRQQYSFGIYNMAIRL